MVFSYPKLSEYDFGIIRLFGSGLGNLLFPWARFIVATKKYNLTPINPTWPQIKIRTFVRGDRDKRSYINFFCTPSRYIKGVKKILLLSKLSKITEEEFIKNHNRDYSDTIVIFEGMKNLFQDILKDSNMILSELVSITKSKHKSGLLFDFSGSISVHVRLGDFRSSMVSRLGKTLEEGGWNLRIPISWYVSKINQLRDELGKQVKVFVFSDGTDEELYPLVSLPNAERIFFGSSIADLLALSRANILVASGSTFSMWASYLGRMPVIWHKGQLRQRLYAENESSEIELSEDENIPNPFFRVLCERT
ncbi:MAG: hypothetical protein AB1401_04840 [Thermodesulfobacteriota bacterium]